MVEYFDGLEGKPGLYLVMQGFLINPTPISIHIWRISTVGSRFNTQKIVVNIYKDDCVILGASRYL